MGPPAVSSVDLRVLGPLELDIDGYPIDVPGRRERAVLTLLGIEVGRPVEVARLGDLLWGSDPPRSADKSLQTFVSRLRHLLGEVPGRLVRRERSYLLALSTEATDLGRFRTLVAQAAGDARAGGAETAVAALEAALVLWRGDHPADLGSTPAALALGQVLRRERGAAVEALVAARLAAGDLEGAVASAERELAGQPDHEPLWALVMRAHVAAGRPTAALDAYERCRRWLAEELGLDPSPLLADLHARILRGEAERPAVVGAPEVARTRAGAATSRPWVSAADRRVSPPPVLTPLIGRQQELEQLEAVLASRRLITLTGAGGVGKTRLAVDGVSATARVAWCDLTTVGGDAAVEDAIAAAVSVLPPPGVPILDAVVAALSGAGVTLVVDNCEHVLDGVRSAVVALLRSCPDLTVLTTSRQPLSIAGEHVLPIAPLPTDVGGPAAILFVGAAERAGGTVSTEEEGEVLQRVCERLDGLPLALELAAPMVRTLGLRGVLDGLAHRFSLFDVAWDATGRERDLRGTVAWSESLLAPPSRHLLRSASVFAGPFTSRMASEVCAPRVDDLDRALADLVDRSLVEPVAGSPPRFRLLENVRAYGRDALGGSARDDLARRHAEWIATRCDHVSDRLWQDDEVHLARSLTEVIDEVRAAVDWVMAAGEAGTGLRIAAGLHGPMVAGVRTDMASWLRDLLVRFGDAPHPRRSEAWGAYAHWLLVCEDDADAAAEAAGRAEAAVDGGPTPPVLWHYRTEAASRAYDIDRAQRWLADARADGLPSGWDHFIEAALVPIELELGQHDRVAERVQRLAPAAAATGSRVLSQLFRLAVGVIEHGDDARRMLALLRDVLDAVGHDETRFIAHHVTMTAATYAVRSGDRELAISTFQDVLGRWGAVGAWRYEWNTIREVVVLLATCGAHEEVVVLDAAGRGSRSAPELIGHQLAAIDAAVNGARATLTSARFAAAASRGAAMSDPDALAYAQDALTRLRP